MRRTCVMALVLAMFALAVQAANVTELKVASQVNPLGIDDPAPRFSWVLRSSTRGTRQVAYQILVARNAADLRRGHGDCWDTGKVESAENAQIAYAGKPLEPRRRYHVTVKVWDEQGRTGLSAPGVFETGRLGEAWQGKFITLQPRTDEDRRPFVGARWIGVPTVKATPPPKWVALRGRFTLPPDETVRWAELHLAVPGVGKGWDRNSRHEVWLNGTQLRGFSAQPADPRTLLVTQVVKPGENEIALQSPYYPDHAMLATLVVELADGRVRAMHTDASWRTRALPAKPDEAWRTEPTDAPGWSPVIDRGAFGDLVNAADPGYRGIDQIVPVVYLRRAFQITKPLARARLYATAAGIYEAELNGRKVGRDVLTPGWTDYDRRLRYQTYDVTTQVKRGSNVLGGAVAGGWFSGRTGMGQNSWGFERALLAELHLEYQDGSREVIATDESWRASTGPERRADMLDGEVYDARRQLRGWSAAGFDDAGWVPAAVVAPNIGRLEAQQEPPVRIVQSLKVKKVTSPAPGVQIFDLGQNMVGWVRVQLRAPAGTPVLLRFAEMLKKDGTLFVENLRSANAVDRYFARGGGIETYEPRFTFHGFRYVEVSGLPKPLPASALVGQVVTSDLAPAGSFQTSNALLNQLQSNIVWGQRGNFLSVPTDCPQRDERVGWTGDINMFARTAVFNMDSAAFLTKYLIDLGDGQRPDGRFPDVAPTIPVLGAGNFGWADAGVTLPWLLYQVYGDTRPLARHYEAMKKWVDFRTRGAKGFLNIANSFGDWVSPKPQAPNHVIGPIYHAASARLLGRIAGVLGKPEEARQYEKLFEDIRTAWNKAYVTPEGKIESDTQTSYVLAIRYDMLPEAQRPAAMRHLVAAIDRANGHLATGFLGTGNLLPALTEVGRTDVAYDLLLRDTYPSWLFTVKSGATTMWERWDSYSPEQGPSNVGDMNSYNHYAFGAVGEWMYAHVAGLDFDPQAPAWRRVIIRPRIGGGLTHARAEHQTIRGKIVSGWRLRGDQLVLDVEIPAHATANVYVPASRVEVVKEGTRPAASAPGVKSIGLQDGAAVFEVGSGAYRFTAPRP